MKYSLIIIIFFLLTGVAYGQLIFKGKSIQPASESINRFLKDNRVDSALIVCSSIMAWPTPDNIYYGLLRQAGIWYMVSFASPPTDTLTDNIEKLKIKQRKLNAGQADSLLKVYKPNVIFRYTQANFDKLPANAPYKKGGLTYEMYINDGSDIHLFWFINNHISHICYPNPGEIYRFAYPHRLEYGILSGFVKCCEGLQSYVNKIRL